MQVRQCTAGVRRDSEARQCPRPQSEVLVPVVVKAWPSGWVTPPSTGSAGSFGLAPGAIVSTGCDNGFQPEVDFQPGL